MDQMTKILFTSKLLIMEIGVILLKSKSWNQGPVGCGVIHTLTKVF